jgi:hypothetical protein
MARLRLLAVAMLSVSVLACGGGGDDADPPGNTGNVPDDAPALPVIEYSGVDAPVEIFSETAGAMADAIVDSMRLAIEAELIVPLMGLQAGVTNESRNGPDGGTVRIMGRIADGLSGWYVAEFDGYREGGATFDGTHVVEFLQTASPQNGSVTRRRTSFHALRHRTEVADLTYTGHITHESCCEMTSEESFSGALLVADESSGRRLYGSEIEIEQLRVTGGSSVEMTLRAFDGRYGYVDAETEGLVYLATLETTPHHGAALRGTGAEGRYLRLVPRTPTVAALEFITIGADAPNVSARVEWGDSFQNQTTRGADGVPRADAGASRYVLPGTEVMLDGRYSTHPNSTFLTHSWRLLYKPPGSGAVLDAPTATTPRLTLDLEGQYLLQLQIDDGAETSRDLVLLTADPQVQGAVDAFMAQLRPDERIGGVAPFELQATPLDHQTFDDVVGRLAIEGTQADGDTLDVQQLDPQLPATATPSVRGVHSVAVTDGPSSAAGVRPLDLQWIATDSPMPFAPAARFVVGDSAETRMSAGYVDGDQRPDLVVTREQPGADTLIDILRLSGDGTFDTPSTLAVPNVGSVALGDVNGDSRTDIVLVGGLEIVILDQTPTGIFSSPRSLALNCFGDPGRDVAVADLNGDGRLDIVVASGCTGQLEYFFQDAGGVMSAALVRDIGVASQLRLAVGDFSGDGVNDVAISRRGGPGMPAVAYFAGTLNGNPGMVQFLTYEPPSLVPQAPPITFADMNGDGRQDIVTAENPLSAANPYRIVILRQAAGGGLQSTLSIETEGESFELRVGDFDRDGTLDIAKDAGATALSVHYGLDTLVFDELVSDQRAGGFPDAVADFNGDSWPDFGFALGREVGVVLGWEHDPD